MNKYKNINIKRVVFTILSVFCIGIIFTQSLLPAGKSSQESSKILELLNGITEFLGMGRLFTHNLVRKCAHFAEFAVLSACLFGMYRTYIQSLLKISLFTSASYFIVAVIDECIQMFSPGRACQFTDVLVDCAGGTCALLFLTVICVQIGKRKLNNTMGCSE